LPVAASAVGASLLGSAAVCPVCAAAAGWSWAGGRLGVRIVFMFGYVATGVCGLHGHRTLNNQL